MPQKSVFQSGGLSSRPPPPLSEKLNFFQSSGNIKYSSKVPDYQKFSKPNFEKFQEF